MRAVATSIEKRVNAIAIAAPAAGVHANLARAGD